MLVRGIVLVAEGEARHMSWAIYALLHLDEVAFAECSLTIGWCQWLRTRGVRASFFAVNYRTLLDQITSISSEEHLGGRVMVFRCAI